MYVWQLQGTSRSHYYPFWTSAQMKKVISMNYGSTSSGWKPWKWVRFHLILTMRNICVNSKLNPVQKVTSSRRTKFKDILPWNISQIITKTIPISTRIVTRYMMKLGILFWVWKKVIGNSDNNMIRISWWRKSHHRRNTRARRKKEIQKNRIVRVTVRDPSRNINHLRKKNYDRVH